jgi:hypothetical protein
MPDSEQSNVLAAHSVTLRDVNQSLDRLDALQCLEMQHLRLRIHRAGPMPDQSVASISRRVPDCVVYPRRAA